ncbi:MAG: branched-chain-amino-acid transaminase [Candidatus Coatesbacteria bacterium]
MKIWLDGKLVEKEQAVVSVFDHGLLYGDGVFEGIRAYNGRVFRLDEHLDRLCDSARAIMLKMPLDQAGIKQAVLDTLRANGLKDAYIRLVVTRGTGDLGLDPRKCPKATMFVIADRISLYPEEAYTKGLTVATVSTRRNLPVALDPRIKSLNYLNNILAKIEANNYGVPEAIMLNAEGYVAECTGDNLFIVRGGRLLTPPTATGALEGITRATVLELARGLNIPSSEENFNQYEIYTAEECFLTGTAAELIPVVTVDTRPIGTGKPGPVTLKLIDAFRELTRREGTPV